MVKSTLAKSKSKRTLPVPSLTSTTPKPPSKPTLAPRINNEAKKDHLPFPPTSPPIFTSHPPEPLQKEEEGFSFKGKASASTTTPHAATLHKIWQEAYDSALQGQPSPDKGLYPGLPAGEVLATQRRAEGVARGYAAANGIEIPGMRERIGRDEEGDGEGRDGDVRGEEGVDPVFNPREFVDPGIGEVRANPFWEEMPRPERWHRAGPGGLAFGETGFVARAMGERVGRDLAEGGDARPGTETKVKFDVAGEGKTRRKGVKEPRRSVEDGEEAKPKYPPPFALPEVDDDAVTKAFEEIKANAKLWEELGGAKQEVGGISQKVGGSKRRGDGGDAGEKVPKGREKRVSRDGKMVISGGKKEA